MLTLQSFFTENSCMLVLEIRLTSTMRVFQGPSNNCSECTAHNFTILFHCADYKVFFLSKADIKTSVSAALNVYIQNTYPVKAGQMFWALVKDVTEVFSFPAPDLSDWKDSLRQTQNRWQENSQMDARRRGCIQLQLLVKNEGTDVMSGNQEAEVVSLRQVQMGHDISLS